MVSCQRSMAVRFPRTLGCWRPSIIRLAGQVRLRRRMVSRHGVWHRRRSLGASGVKLYLPYHPDDPHAVAQKDLVRQVAEECEREAVPFFLEPVAASNDADAPVGSARFASQRRRIVLAIVERLGPLGADVLKLQFPLDVPPRA